MGIVRFERQDRSAALGVRLGDEVVDLADVGASHPSDLTDLLAQGGDEAVRRVMAQAQGCARRLPYAGLRLLAPTVRAGKIICLGLNYHEHAAESRREAPDYPVVFFRAASSLVGHGSPLVRPRMSDELDWEAELVAFVGRRARHVSEAQALSYVSGYSCFNDGSVRDYQKKTQQWTVGKNFDGTGGFGPEFIPASELPPGASGLQIECRVNGSVVQRANTSQMIFDVARTLALMSECMTLEPGDLLVMGTPGGVGVARKPPVFLRPGDVCEVEIEGLGVLRNPIVQEDAQA